MKEIVDGITHKQQQVQPRMQRTGINGLRSTRTFADVLIELFGFICVCTLLEKSVQEKWVCIEMMWDQRTIAGLFSVALVCSTNSCVRCRDTSSATSLSLSCVTTHGSNMLGQHGVANTKEKNHEKHSRGRLTHYWRQGENVSFFCANHQKFKRQCMRPLQSSIAKLIARVNFKPQHQHLCCEFFWLRPRFW